ncbi:LppX_LprAFG lipoprotein [Mycolicibacter acidiphilus]
MRRLLAVIALTSAVAAPATACSPSQAPSTSASNLAGRPLPDSAALLKQSSTATKNLKSVHLVLGVTGKIEAMSIKSLDGDVTNEPSTAAKGKATIMIMGASVDIDFVVFGGHLYALLPGGAWHDYGPASKVSDVVSILNPHTGLANLLTDFVDPKAEARETIDGQQTIRIVGKVTADAANKVVPPLDATKKVSSTVWIQENGDHQLVRATLAPTEEDAVQMTLSGWNAPVTVVKPAGA